jgi:ABC-type nitrate/sulfonate/bicarbonate transport system substrate-binding protein
MKTKTVLAGLALLTSIAAGAPMTAHAMDNVKIVIPRDSVFVLNYQGAKDAGIYSKHGIDLDVDVRPFAGFLASLPSKQTMATTYSGLDAIAKMDEGVDWVIIGGGLTVVQQVYVLKSSPFKTMTDLRGKKIGTFSTGAGSFKAARAAIMEAYGFDISKDANLVQLPAPALFDLVKRGEVDAMINISSFSVEAASQPDEFRSIFAPDEYWKEKTGYPILWAAPIVAWRSWVDENPTRAKNFAAATEESFEWLRQPENLDAAVKTYGELAGVTKPEEIATYKKWLGAKQMFLTEWNQKVADSAWKFLEMAQHHGIIDKVPSEKDHALLLGN